MTRQPAYFKTVLKTEDLDGRNFRLTDPLLFYSAELQQTVIAPAGFETDLSSIPRIFWIVLPKTGRYDPAAVLHDGGYEGRLLDMGGQPFLITKDQADRLFREAMIARGVGTWPCLPMYYAVKWFGHGKFTEKQEQAHVASGR